ncbi:MAG: hypothetical protein AB1393_11055 [Candidatus Edwardsbacteria bacterium]
MSKNLRASEQSGMYKSSSQKIITIEQLEKDMESLRKKMFLYETLQAEKEIEKEQVKGPFKSGKEVINHIKR